MILIESLAVQFTFPNLQNLKRSEKMVIFIDRAQWKSGLYPCMGSPWLGCTALQTSPANISIIYDPFLSNTEGHHFLGGATV